MERMLLGDPHLLAAQAGQLRMNWRRNPPTRAYQASKESARGLTVLVQEPNCVLRTQVLQSPMETGSDRFIRIWRRA